MELLRFNRIDSSCGDFLNGAIDEESFLLLDKTPSSLREVFGREKAA